MDDQPFSFKRSRAFLPENPSPLTLLPFLPPMASSDLEAATALKVQGNKAFGQHEWPTAVDFYTQAIAKYDREPSFFSNRAQVRCALGTFCLLPLALLLAPKAKEKHMEGA